MAEKKTIVRTDSLSTDRINGSFDDDFISCPICTNVLWRPIACKNCENAFCMKCIRLWLKDNPNKCPFNCRFQERKPPPILLKILSKLRLNCRNKLNGCSSVCFYEALEKHEQQECVYRLIQCPGCLKEILQKDSESHATDECLSKEITCFKCGSVYRQLDGHIEEQCLKVQITLLNEKLRDQEDKPKKVMENYNKMIDLHNRYLVNDESSWNDSNDISPSAPPAEEEPIPTSAPNLNREEIPRESLRITTIDFSRIDQRRNHHCVIPNGYAGFNWENAYYMDRDLISTNRYLNGFQMAFHDSQKYVAYNSRSAALTLYLPDPGQTFGVHSFEAICIHHATLKVFITAYRSNVVINRKSITVSSDQLKLFEIDCEQIDRIVFAPESLLATMKPATFALSTLNLVL